MAKVRPKAAVLDLTVPSWRDFVAFEQTFSGTENRVMWTCAKCGEKIEDQFDSCRRCSSHKVVAAATRTPVAEGGAEDAQKWRMAYRKFRGTFATWDKLFAEAAQFATEIGPERVLSISHSADQSDGVVTVWYWTPEPENEN